MYTIKKVLFVNGWSDLNKGDSGIVFGMIDLLKGSLPNVKISILSEFSEKDYRFVTGYKHLVKHYTDLKVYGSLLPYTPILHGPKEKTIHKFIRVIIRLWYFIRSLLILFSLRISNLLLSNSEKETLRILQETDVVISKGGHIFYSLGGIGSLIGLYQHAFPLLLSIKLEKPFIFYAQSIGPFKGKVNRWFARQIFLKASLIMVREDISRDTVMSLGIPIEKIKVVPDAAFSINYTRHLDKKASLELKSIGIGQGERFVGITVRQWFFGRDRASANRYREYLKSMARLVDHIVEHYKMKVVFMPQVLGPTKAENDLIAIRQTYDLIQNKYGVYILDKDLSPIDLLYIYKESYIFVGTRFHSVIFALLMNIPSLAISYFGPKSLGIMKMIGLSDFVLDINNISYKELSNKVDILIKKRDTISLLIKGRVSILRNNAKNIPNIIIHAVDKYYKNLRDVN